MESILGAAQSPGYRERMRKGYGQFCPVSKAAEVLAERWMPLVVRELLYGSSRWADFRRGIPLISPAVLSQRLRELEDAGVVERREDRYLLTQAGRELAPVIEQLGIWGKRWTQHQIDSRDADPLFLMWAAHRHLGFASLPARATLCFEFQRVPPARRRFWLVVQDGAADVCLKDPGGEVDVTVDADARALASVYLGLVEPSEALRSGGIRLEGKSALVRSFPSWCPRSRFAKVPRPRSRKSRNPRVRISY